MAHDYQQIYENILGFKFLYDFISHVNVEIHVNYGSDNDLYATEDSSFTLNLYWPCIMAYE